MRAWPSLLILTIAMSGFALAVAARSDLGGLRAMHGIPAPPPWHVWTDRIPTVRDAAAPPAILLVFVFPRDRQPLADAAAQPTPADNVYVRIVESGNGNTHDESELGTGLLIDATGRVRRAERLDSESDVVRFAARVTQWRAGREVYAQFCAACHGMDGTNTGYPLIKTLDGIGRRISDTAILARTRATSFTNIDALPEEERDALAIFVAGL